MTRNQWLLIGLGVFILMTTGGTVLYFKARGYRNNNPLNLRRTSDNWEGLAEEQTDPDFFQFVSPEYGIRAAAKVMRTYREKYGINTIAQIISRWAPASENDTAAYIRHVSNAVEIDQTAPLNFPTDLYKIVPLMAKHENGFQAYSGELYRRGIDMAFG